MTNRQERRAAKALKRKSKGARLSIAAATQKAKKMHQAGQLKEAEQLYRRIIKTAPQHADALNFFGILLHQVNRSEEAISMLQDAISASPDYADAYNNLGIVYKGLERFDEAAKAFQTCLDISPGHVNALNNYGTVFRAQKKYQAAIEQYQQALSINPEFVDAYANLGYAQYKLERVDDAVATYLKAIELSPYDPKAYRRLCLMLYIEKREKEAIELLDKWLEMDPDHPTARHMHASFSGNNVPARASDTYITQTFDSFASTFDSVLRDLDYRAPQYVSDAVKRLAGHQNRPLDMLDAGCGTGLLAPLVHGFAKSLVGVDLSSQMIRRAEGLALYSALHTDEITRFMLSHPDQYDMVMSVDTLIYFGDLDGVFRAAYRTLREDGYMIVSLEEITNPEEEEHRRLNPHGRYSHSADYVKSSLASSGFELESLKRATLRKEAGNPVAGMIVVALKTSST